MIKYSDLGTHRQLNDIVMAGSHDAGITEGKSNAKTQSYNIFMQACSGVRFFDVRVTGTMVNGVVQHKAFHVQGPNVTKSGKVDSLGNYGDFTVKKNIAGTFGMELSKILAEAKAFVESFPSEFLILKFDKGSNEDTVAEACRRELGNAIYKGAGNLNEKTLSDLAGTVVCAFMPGSYSKLSNNADRQWIVPIKNLYSPPGTYDPNFNGLQYWGSGGTSVMTPFTGFEGKVKDNVKKQTKIFTKASTGIAPQTKREGFLWRKKKQIPGCQATNPNTMGMMYWTSTGITKSIKERNDVMWSDKNMGGLDELWSGGFDSWVANALPQNVDVTSFGSSSTLKLFMPNIVMIDFADPQKCKYIYALNELAGCKLTNFINSQI